MRIAFILLVECFASFSLAQVMQEPRPMMYHGLVYHHRAEKAPLFGGVSKHGWISDINEVWQYDWKSESWSMLGDFEAISDSTVHGQSPVYHQGANRVIVFNSKGETWAYEWESRKWENRNPPVAPSPRCGHHMTYDVESEKIVLFGGFGCTSIEDPIFGDTWVYDYKLNLWSQKESLTRPPARMYGSIAYNSKADRISLWG